MRIVMAVLLSFVLAAATGCGKSSNAIQPEHSPPASVSPADSPAPSPTAEPTTPPRTDEPEPDDKITEQIATMTLDEKIGQLLLIGLDGYSPSAFAKEMVQQNKVGGFILYKDNIKDVAQTVNLLNELKAANTQGAAPLWLSLDQEGGKVSRLPSEIHAFPSARELGANDDADRTAAVGQAIGQSVGALGFNMDFAPVLDIDSNPANPVIGNRSFGSDADTVIRHGLSMLDGISASGVAAVVKHFPGHGDTSVDSHYALPVVNKSLEELEQLELLPFAEAVNRKADAVMVAHLLIPALDKKYPTSISEHAINGLLRTTLGYDGVVVTDDMTMGGLLQDNDIGDAAVQAVLAGADLLLVGHKEALQKKVLTALQKSVESGVITESRLDESVRRLLILKEAYQLSDQPASVPDISSINKNIDAAIEGISGK